MSLTNFIPTVWSETLYRELEKEYVAVKNCNRDYEGDIKNIGDTVQIVGIDAVTISNYNPGSSVYMHELQDNVRQLVIDKSNYFNFFIDDINVAQSSPKIMQEAMRRAASGLSDAVDKYIFSFYSQIEEDKTITKTDFTSSDVIDYLLSIRQSMLESNVSGSEEIILEVTPAVAAKIVKAKILHGTSNENELENGCIGTFLGFRIFVSNNVYVVEEGEDGAKTVFHKCFARTKRAIAFASQLNKVEAYRPEKRFADGMRGLNLYGAKIIYPSEIRLVNISIGQEA